MKAKNILAWALPAAVFAAAGFLSLLSTPKWEEVVRTTLATFTDYASSTAG
ncbi:MAG TPA: hypothetical protein VF950_22560 [Planctomycetota bacterium]